MQLAFYLWVFTLIGLSCGVKISTRQHSAVYTSAAKERSQQQTRQIASEKRNFPSLGVNMWKMHVTTVKLMKKERERVNGRTGNVGAGRRTAVTGKKWKTAINHSCWASFKYKSISIFHLSRVLSVAASFSHSRQYSQLSTPLSYSMPMIESLVPKKSWKKVSNAYRRSYTQYWSAYKSISPSSNAPWVVLSAEF